MKTRNNRQPALALATTDFYEPGECEQQNRLARKKCFHRVLTCQLRDEVDSSTEELADRVNASFALVAEVKMVLGRVNMFANDAFDELDDLLEIQSTANLRRRQMRAIYRALKILIASDFDEVEIRFGTNVKPTVATATEIGVERTIRFAEGQLVN